MNALMKLAFLFTAGASTATLASSSYRLSSFQTSDSATCQREAIMIGQSFEAISGSTNVNARCFFDQLLDEQYIEISFENTDRLGFFSTATPGILFEKTAFYKTKQECLRERPIEVQTFQTATGVAPFVAYCHTDTGTLDRYPWTLRIDAAFAITAQIPRIRPLLTSYYLAGSPYSHSESEVTSDLTSAAQRDVLILSRVAFRNHTPSNNITALFYGSELPNWNAFTLNTNTNMDNCKGELLELKAIYQRASRTTVTAYCGSPYSGPSRFDLFVIAKGRVPDSIFGAEVFSSFADCVQNRSAIVAEYNRGSTTLVLGGICVTDWSGSGTRLQLLKM